MVAKKKTTLRETDLYAPIRDFLTAQGYLVRSEVRGCDVTATKDDDLIVVELKLRPSIELLIQAAQRQKITDSVYVAVPRPDKMPWKRWRSIQHLLRRLELGLITVAFTSPTPYVEIAFHPVPFQRQKRKAARRALIQEIDGRSADFNEGGSRRRKLVTAYRESALRIAVLLDKLGAQSPKALRVHGTGPKTTTILYSNVYGWFQHIDRALYDITPEGRAALKTYAGLAKRFRKELASRGKEG